jgi:plasmid stabilization system protein ParE
MNDSELFTDSSYVNQTRLAERELSAFIGAVTKLFGPEQARASTQDWLEEAELMDSPPRSAGRNWRAVTIAASVRLASRIDAASPVFDKAD